MVELYGEGEENGPHLGDIQILKNILATCDSNHNSWTVTEKKKVAFTKLCEFLV